MGQRKPFSVTIKRFPVAALILAAMFFGVAPTGEKYVLEKFGPITSFTVALVTATVVLWTLLLRRGYRRPKSWGRVLILGCLEPGMAHLLFSFGLNLTSASNAALISALESCFVVVFAVIFLRERVGRAVVVAVLMAVFGMVVLEGASSFGAPGSGDLLVVLGTVCAAVYTIVARGLSPDDDSLTVTAHQFGFATLLVLPMAIMSWTSKHEEFPVDVPLRFWLVALLVGIFGCGVSFLLYNAAIVWIAAGPAGVIINLAPAFGLTSAVLWLGEPLTAARAIGASLVGLSVALFLRAERGRRTTPTSSVVDLNLGDQPAQCSPVRATIAPHGGNGTDHHDLVG